MKKIIMMTFCLIFLAFNVWALTGLEIIEKMDSVDVSDDSKSQLYMKIHKKGKIRERRIISFIKKYGDDEKLIMKFFSPADIKGTMYLLWHYAEIYKNADIWIFFPESNLVRKISAAKRKNRFMGSDFTHEDIEKREVDYDEHKFISEEVIDNILCYKVESISTKDGERASQYGKWVTWVRKDYFLPIKIDFYDKNLQHIKTLECSEYEKVQDIWTIKKMIMRDLRKDGCYTELIIEGISYNLGLKDSLFDRSNLKR